MAQEKDNGLGVLPDQTGEKLIINGRNFQRVHAMQCDIYEYNSPCSNYCLSNIQETLRKIIKNSEVGQTIGVCDDFFCEAMNEGFF